MRARHPIRGYRDGAMTDERSDTNTEAVIDEALGVIDQALARMMQRELVSSGEVADLLLDVRTLLTTDVSDRPVEPVAASDHG